MTYLLILDFGLQSCNIWKYVITCDALDDVIDRQAKMNSIDSTKNERRNIKQVSVTEQNIKNKGKNRSVYLIFFFFC